MAIEYVSGGVTAAKGFTASGIHCGIRKNKTKKDLALIYSEVPCSAAAVYTKNLVKGAPLIVTKKNLANATAQAIICNSGNANTCNADGEEKAIMMCDLIAKELNISSEDVIVASTGVIGQILPIEPISSSVKELAQALDVKGGSDAAQAILTTDTHQKEIAVSFNIGDKKVTMGGIAKGSGMIHPNMATMLCFLTTDAAISHELIHDALIEAVDVSFNMVSVDGDTSTNDMVALLANGKAENVMLTEKNEDYFIFVQALKELTIALSKEIAGDGEGATKLLICRVEGGATHEDAQMAAKSVICSSLLKAAMFGADANWGRVLCALGYAGSKIDINGVDVSFESAKGRIDVCKNGSGIDFSEEKAKEILLEKKIIIDVKLRDGTEKAEAFGCDLTYDYVKINGDYRT